MKIQIIYDSKKGHTKKATSYFKYEIQHVLNAKIWADVVLFLCPTYGDEELPEDMENFIINLKIKNKLFVICELGNYYGYDTFEFGAKKIIKNKLKTLGWKQFYKNYSLDSFPKINNFENFNKWKCGLENALQNKN